jgi:curved DNA-binding protein CbpA
MVEADLYKVLGVPSSASVDKIKSAYRKLVKKYHPDLFSTPAQKASATDRLRQINEAYAVLGDPERRRGYDQRFQTAAAAKRPSAATKRTTKPAASTPRRPTSHGTNFPDAAKARRFIQSWKQRVSVRWAGCILGAMALFFVAYAGWNEPEATVVWMLLERTEEIQPSEGPPANSPRRTWTSLGRHTSRTECADHLNETVRNDEQQGSKAIWDERDRTIAITVYTKNEADLADEYFHASLRQTTPGAVDEQRLKQKAREEAKEFIRKNGAMKRVRNLECHQLQVQETDSRLRRVLRKIPIMN